MPEKDTASLVPSQVAQPNKASTAAGGDIDGSKTTNLNRNRRRRPKKKSADHNKKKNDVQQGEDDEQATTPAKGSKSKHPKKSQSKKQSHKRKKITWRKYIKQGECDPISLEPLISLPYPPFALAISKPYVPIPVWPENKDQSSTKGAYKKEDEDKRQQEILKKQWGSKIHSKEDGSSKNNSEAPDNDVTNDNTSTKANMHVHLFDGQVLAYYLVSQLQFIDPLNRRDLTRDEIINLDEYLRRHKIKHTSVLEAYDSKGVTLNSAGVSGQTRAGRAEILQQEAQVLLNALFQNNGQQRRTSGREANVHEPDEANQFSRQYAAFETDAVSRRRRNNRRGQRNNNTTNIDQNEGIFSHEGGGMTIIDDNINPGLRGVNQITDTANFVLHQPSSAGTWNLHNNFPQLETFPTLTSTTNGNTSNAEERDIAMSQLKSRNEDDKKRVVSKSLLKIGKVIKKTNQKDIEKRKKAREEALRKMEMANLPYEEYLRRRDNPTTIENIHNETYHDPMSVAKTGTAAPSEGQLERNRNLAEALGVKPSTNRQITGGLIGGWKRPTDAIDEFGKELEETQYPDTLLKEAKERMQELLKLEKKWIDFLQDDTACSCSLKKMDKPTRIFVHTYSDFWQIQTRSYDPEPRRYIHCVKLHATFTPHPLLSVAAKNWKGPSLSTPNLHDEIKHPKIQPSQLVNEAAMNTEQRQKLTLEPRTKPLDLPPFQILQIKADEEKWKSSQNKKLEALCKKKSEKEERKNRILAAAFASDDEMDSSDSEWDVGDAVFSGSEEE